MSEHAKIFKEAQQRIPSQKEKILNLLKERKEEGVLNTELTEISLRFTATLFNLKSEGYDIVTENIKDGIVKYTLKDKLLKRDKYKKGIDVVKEEITASYKGLISGEQLEEILTKYGLNIIRKPNALHKA